MPDLCKLVTLFSHTHTRCKNSDLRMNRAVKSKSFDNYLSDWVAKKKEMGVPESKLVLPFLVGAPKHEIILCRVCENVINPEEVLACSMSKCRVSYHSRCSINRFGSGSSEDIKCPQHECYHCNKKSCLLRCTKCDLASHEKCAAYPEYIIRPNERSGEIICWRHSVDSQPLKHAVPTSSIEDVFGRLPLSYVEKEFEIDPKWRDSTTTEEPPSNVQPSDAISTIEEVFGRLPLSYVEKEFEIDPKWRDSTTTEEPPSNVQPSDAISTIKALFRHLPIPNVEEEFKIDLTWKGTMADLEPPSYVHITRNIYRTKKKSCNADISIGDCTCCDPHVCYDACMCRAQNVSCSSACKCSENCTNRQFQEQKKVKVVMTQHCGWGVEADEFIDKEDYIIEYVGEVIDDDLCEKRFWDMKGQGITKFYLVQVGTDFNIDAKFKGNEARFINHSCDPNCTMEKWEVNGKTRLGIFAAKSIKPGEELTFDYGFELYEHVEVKCLCGASNCRGYLGTKKGQRG